MSRAAMHSLGRKAPLAGKLVVILLAVSSSMLTAAGKEANAGSSDFPQSAYLKCDPLKPHLPGRSHIRR
jgi:hypothetical protein